LKRQPVKKPLWQSSPGRDLPEAARAYAFLLLKFRLRSENELLSRLVQKGFSKEIAAETVDFLKNKKFIDDRLFARGWVGSRLKKPFGLRKIKQELVARGLDKEIIEDSLKEAKKDYSESQVVGGLARNRLAKLTGIDPQKAKMRTYAYLLRRGFSPDVVGETIRQL
jgi:regulatory protein